MINVNISLDLYKIFCAVVEARNMSVAAKALYVSQPAVSMAIKQLEDKFGKPLLIRSSKGIRTTPEGSTLYDYVSKGLQLINVAEQKYFEMLNLEAGEIRIGASDTILAYYLLPHIEHYINLYGAINFKATNRTSYETITLLKSGSVDIGFVNMPVKYEEQIEIIECLEVHDCLVCGSKYKHLAEKGLSIKELNEYPLLMLEGDSNTRRFIDDYALGHDVILNSKIELGSNDLLIDFAKINLGLTFGTREYIKDKLDGETLFEIPLLEEVPSRSIGLVKLKGIALSYAASKFCELLNVGLK